MRTVGVDLAAEPAKTAAAVVEWRNRRATVVDVRLGATDDDLVRITAAADRTGIDAPFGWPDAFVDFVAAHHRHAPPTTGPLNTRIARGPLVRRMTDDVVRDETGLVPLSVSADLIAHVALRCSTLLHALDVADRVDGAAVEAYPAAALRVWGLHPRGYKGARNVEVRAVLLDGVLQRAPWLDLGVFDDLCHSSDDVFDAVIAACIARAAATGGTRAPTARQRPVAAREGWIHLPTASLADLVED